MAVSNFVTGEDFGKILAFMRVPSSDSEQSLDFSEWECQFMSTVDLKNPSKFVECFRNFIENVISFVCDKTYSQQFLFSKQSCLLLKKVTDSTSKDSLVKLVTKLVFEFIIEENAEYWIIKRELLKVLIDWTRSAAYSTRQAVVKEMPIIYLCKMIDSISSCGDYDFQVSIIELIFLMYGRTLICDGLKDLIPESPELSQSLADIDLDNFEGDCRLFLNTINLKSEKIFSIVCTGIQMGKDVCAQPLLNIGCVWVDFNLSDKAVSWYCDSRADENDEPTWQLITFFIPEIRSVKTMRNTDVYLIHFQLNNDQLMSSDENPILNEIKDIKLFFEKSERAEELFTVVLDNLFGNEDSPGNKDFKPLPVKISKPSSRPDTTRYARGVFSKCMSEVSSNMGSIQYFKSRMFNESNSIYSEDYQSIDAVLSHSSLVDDPNHAFPNDDDHVLDSQSIQMLSGNCSTTYVGRSKISKPSSLPDSPEYKTAPDYFENTMKISKSMVQNKGVLKTSNRLSRSSLIDDPNHTFPNDDDHVLDSQSIQMLSGNCSTTYIGVSKISKPSSLPNSPEYKTAVDYFENAPKIRKSTVQNKGVLKTSNRQNISELTGRPELTEDFDSMEVNMTSYSDKENWSDVPRNRDIDISSDLAERLISSHEVIELNTPDKSEPKTVKSLQSQEGTRQSSPTPPGEVNSVLEEHDSDHLGPENISAIKEVKSTDVTISKKISRFKDDVISKDESRVDRNSLKETTRLQKETGDDSQKAEEKNLSLVILDDENNNEKVDNLKETMKISKDIRKPDESSNKQNTSQLTTTLKISPTKKVELPKRPLVQNQDRGVSKKQKERQLMGPQEQGNEEQNENRSLDNSRINIRTRSQTKKKQTPKEKREIEEKKVEDVIVIEDDTDKNSLKEKTRLEQERDDDSERAEEESLSQIWSISEEEYQTPNESETESTKVEEIIVIEDETDKNSTKKKTKLEQGREEADQKNKQEKDNNEKEYILKKPMKISKNEIDPGESSKKKKTLKIKKMTETFRTSRECDESNKRTRKKEHEENASVEVPTEKDQDILKERVKTKLYTRKISRSQDNQLKKIIKISRTNTSTNLDKKTEKIVEETFVIEDDSTEENDVDTKQDVAGGSKLVKKEVTTNDNLEKAQSDKKKRAEQTISKKTRRLGETKLRNDEGNKECDTKPKLTQLREVKITEDLEKSRREKKKRSEEPLSKKTRSFGKTKLRDDEKIKEADNIEQKVTGLTVVKIAEDLEKSQPENDESANELLSKEIRNIEETKQRKQKTPLKSKEYDNSENKTRVSEVEINEEIEKSRPEENKNANDPLSKEIQNFEKTKQRSEETPENSRPEKKKGVKDPPKDIHVFEKTNLKTEKPSTKDNEHDLSKKTLNESGEVVKAKQKRKSTKIKRSLEQERSVDEIKSLKPDEYQKESSKMDGKSKDSENLPEIRVLQNISSDNAKQTEIEATTETRNLQDDDLFAEPEDYVKSNQKEVQRDPKKAFTEDFSEDSPSLEKENVSKGRKKILTKKLSKKRINIEKQKRQVGDNLESSKGQKTAAIISGPSSDTENSQSENLVKMNKTVKKYKRKEKGYYDLNTEESPDQVDWSENEINSKNENRNISKVDIIDKDIESYTEQEKDPYELTTAGSQKEDEGSGRDDLVSDVEDPEKGPRNTLSGNSENIENIEREINTYVAYDLSSEGPPDDGEGNGTDPLRRELISVLEDQPPNVPEIEFRRLSDDEENRIVSLKVREIVDANKKLDTKRTKKSNIVKKRKSIEKEEIADGDGDDQIEIMEVEKEKETGNEKRDSLEEFFSITGYENSSARKTETRESVNIDKARENIENNVAESDAYSQSTMEFVTNERSASRKTDTEERVNIDNAGENIEINESEDDAYNRSTLEFVRNDKSEDQGNEEDIMNRELKEVEDKIFNFPDDDDTEFPTEETVAVKEKPKTLVSRKTRKLYDPETFMEGSRTRDFNATDLMTTRKRKSDIQGPDSNRLGNLNQTFPTTSRELRKIPGRPLKSIKETTETGSGLNSSPILPAHKEIIETDTDEIVKKRRKTKESLGEASTSQQATQREKSSRKIRETSEKFDIFETPKFETPKRKQKDEVKRKPFSQSKPKDSPYYFGSRPKKTTTTEELFEENASFKKKCEKVHRISKSVGLSDNFARLNARFEKMIASSFGGKRVSDYVKQIEKEDKSKLRHSAPNKRKSTDMNKGKVDKRGDSDKENRKMKDNFSRPCSTPKKRKSTDIHTSPKRKTVTNKSPQEDVEIEQNGSCTIPVVRKQLKPKNAGKKIVIVSDIQVKPADLETGPVDQESISKPGTISEHNDLDDHHSLETENADQLFFGCLVGKPAPAWTGNAFFNDEIITIDSGQYLGKYLVLFFYPQDFGHLPEMEAPKEVFSFNESHEILQQLTAEIVGCSTNFISTHEVWLKTIRPVKLNFPLLADPTHTISKSFMVYLDNFGHSTRAAVIIDPNGDIISITCTDVKIVISIDEVIDKIRLHKSYTSRV